MYTFNSFFLIPEYLGRLQCIANSPDTYKIQRCMDKFVLDLNLVANNSSEENLFPDACCAIHLHTDCFERTVPQVCPESTEYVVSYVKSVVGEIFDLVCGSQSNLNNCRKKKPAIMKSFRKIPFKYQKTSIFAPLIKMAVRIDVS